MQFSNVENKDYKLPSLDILKFPKNKQVTNENAEIYENARKLERTFQSFGVKAKVTKVHRGLQLQNMKCILIWGKGKQNCQFK